MTSAYAYAPTRGSDGNWATNAPVFSCERNESVSPGEHALPIIRVTAKVKEPTPELTGRTAVQHYPDASAGSDSDPDGLLALRFGANYYEEGMCTQDERFHQDRIDCFRAAELLYLWSACKGNVQAYVNLGYVYGYDRCEGQYLGVDEWGRGAHEANGEFPRERRAYECLKVAADACHPEACYKLGDLVSQGRGCAPSLTRAIDLWETAFRLASDVDVPVWWGSAALRLGDAYEEGKGCAVSFSEALRWYELAETGLQIAVDLGDWYYKKALARARGGVLRCKQELDGRY